MVRTLCLMVMLHASHTWARTWWMNPANMGSNAVAGFAIEAPWTEKYTLLQISGGPQYGWLYDFSIFPQFRLITPFGKWISTYIEGGPVELWWSSPVTRQEWGFTQESGVSKADIRFGFKFLLADFGPSLPKIGFRAITKSTTGKSYAERRFTDGPAYLLDILVGERFKFKSVQIDILGMGGYWIWQQGEAGQNDAITWGAAVAAQFFERWTSQVELRGYIGWQTGDKPIVFGAKTGVVLAEWFELAVGLNIGFRDAARLEGLLFLNFRLPLLAPLLFDFAPGKPLLANPASP
jgi:hypothetical protein